MNTTDNITPDSNTNTKNTKKKSHPLWQAFWLTFLVLSLAYAWYSFYVPSNDVIWVENIVAAKKKASEADKNMMLFFTGDWCVPCRIMKREVFADEEVMQAVNSDIIPVLIDIDDPNAQELVKQYNIGTTPITIFTDAEGNVLDYAVGKIGKTKFLEMFENLNGKDS